uniref:Uncharacterized protein n=1 Tax=Sphaerodactylus townsendi TaxID=933632 RepID=A0ACB8EX75_9SAUR
MEERKRVDSLATWQHDGSFAHPWRCSCPGGGRGGVFHVSYPAPQSQPKKGPQRREGSEIEGHVYCCKRQKKPRAREGLSRGPTEVRIVTASRPPVAESPRGSPPRAPPGPPPTPGATVPVLVSPRSTGGVNQAPRGGRRHG